MVKKIKKIIKEKRPQKQWSWGEGSFLGNVYQAFVATEFIYEMMTCDLIKYVQHQIIWHVDDIYVEYNNWKKLFIQCKKWKDKSLDIVVDCFRDYLEQNNDNIEFVIYSQDPYQDIDSIQNAINSYVWINKKNTLETYLEKSLSKVSLEFYKNIRYNCDTIWNEKKWDNTAQKLFFTDNEFKKFINLIKIYSKNFNSIINDIFTHRQYDEIAFSIIYKYICYQRYKKAVYKTEAIGLVNKLYPSFLKSIMEPNINNNEIKNDAVKNDITKKVRTFEKVQIINLYINKKSIADLAIELAHDNILLRHFLHNQKDASLFMDIKDKLVDTIIAKQDDETVKFKLLDYFADHCTADYSDEIIDIIGLILQNTKNIALQRKIWLFIEKLDPKKNIESLCDILCWLIRNSDQIVKEFTTRSATKFIDQYDEKQINGLLKAMFFSDWSDEDVTQSSISLSLKFRGQDLKDASFRESANFLWEILQRKKYALKFMDLTIEIYNSILADRDWLISEDEWKIKSTYSWWLPKTFPVQESKFEYESQRDKRIALEIRNALIEIDREDKVIAKKLCEKIIEKWEYLVYFEILSRFLADKWDEYQSIIESLLHNEDLRRVANLLEPKRFSLFRHYLTEHTEKISTFETSITNYKLDEKKVEAHIQAELATIIPEGKRSSEMQQLKDDYEKWVRKEHNIDGYTLKEDTETEREPFAMGKPSTFDPSYLSVTREITDLKKIIEQYIASESVFDMDIWDLAWPFEWYISRNPEQLVGLYNEIKSLDFKNRWQWLLGWLARGYIAHYKNSEKDAFYEQMIALYEIFSDIQNPNEAPARLEIARVLDNNDFVRSEDMGKLKESTPELFEKMKKLVIGFSTDPDPRADGPAEHVGLNSVRWTWATLVCILSFYYPKTEADLTVAIRALSDDINPGIQAQLIDNMIYLIPDTKDYDLCKEIIAKFKTANNPIIQNALARYMFRLGNTKLEKNKDLILRLCQSEDDNVRKQIWDLVWQALLNDADVKDIFDSILQMQSKDEILLESLTMVFQNKMRMILSEADATKRDKYLWYFEQIIDSKPVDKRQGHAVWSRLWYCFHDAEKLPETSFDIFNERWILNKMVCIQNQDTQKNINKFFLRFIGRDEYIEKILDLLLKQTELKLNNTYPVMLIDAWLAEEIVKILKYLYAKNKEKHLSKVVFEKMEKLFDEWLKYGEKWFYEIFDARYK